MAYQGGDVDARRHRLDRLTIAGEGVIGEVIFLTEQVERFADAGVKAQRSRGDAAIPDDQRGNTLADLRRHVRLADANQIVMGVRVNETRRHDQARNVDDPDGRDLRQVADGDDRIVTHGDVGSESRLTTAVNDQPSFQNKVGVQDVFCHVTVY